MVSKHLVIQLVSGDAVCTGTLQTHWRSPVSLITVVPTLCASLFPVVHVVYHFCPLLVHAVVCFFIFCSASCVFVICCSPAVGYHGSIPLFPRIQGYLFANEIKMCTGICLGDIPIIFKKTNSTTATSLIKDNY